MSSHSLSSFKSEILELKSKQLATSSNKLSIVNHISSITGGLIWGEQNNADLLSEFFKENVMEVYSSLLSQDFDRVITIQLLQSSSMLIHNLSKGSSKSELLKTDYFKHVLSHPFDFADSEIVENYMSLLKGIAVNLHLTELRDYLIENNFNLFTGAMIFYNNNETIIRTSARNVVLRVLEVNDEIVNNFILTSGFLNNLANYLKESIISISRSVDSSKNLNKLEQVVSECLDLLYELNDIFELNNLDINDRLQDILMKMIFLPVLSSSIVEAEPKVYHLPMPIALYAFTLIVKIFNHQGIREEILIVLFASRISRSYLEVMINPPNRSLPKLERSSEIVPNPVHSFIFRFLKCREDNLLGLSLALVQSVFHKSILDFFSCSDLPQRAVLEHLLDSFQTIFTSEAETRFFTVFLACKLCLDLYSSDIIRSSESDFHSLVQRAISFRSKTILTYIESSSNPMDLIHLFKTEEEFISSQNWEDYLNLPLNYLMTSIGNSADLPLEVRRSRVESEYLKSDIRLLLLFKRLKGLMKPVEERTRVCVLPFDSIAESTLVAGEFYDVDSEFIQGKTIRKVVEKGITGHVRYIIDDKNYLILASLHTDMDCYLIETSVRFSKLNVLDRPEPNVIVLVTENGETLMLVFEDNKEWITMKNVVEKRVKKCVEYDVGLLKSFIMEDN